VHEYENEEAAQLSRRFALSPNKSEVECAFWIDLERLVAALSMDDNTPSSAYRSINHTVQKRAPHQKELGEISFDIEKRYLSSGKNGRQRSGSTSATSNTNNTNSTNGANNNTSTSSRGRRLSNAPNTSLVATVYAVCQANASRLLMRALRSSLKIVLRVTSVSRAIFPCIYISKTEDAIFDPPTLDIDDKQPRSVQALDPTYFASPEHTSKNKPTTTSLHDNSRKGSGTVLDDDTWPLWGMTLSVLGDLIHISAIVPKERSRLQKYSMTPFLVDNSILQYHILCWTLLIEFMQWCRGIRRCVRPYYTILGLSCVSYMLLNLMILYGLYDLFMFVRYGQSRYISSTMRWMMK
jgi:hypothetical protein